MRFAGVDIGLIDLGWGEGMDAKQNKPPLVSVVMPAYNSSATITESINSVLAQTYQNWELFIIDDASTDNTVEIAKIYGS